MRTSNGDKFSRLFKGPWGLFKAPDGLFFYVFIARLCTKDIKNIETRLI